MVLTSSNKPPVFHSIYSTTSDLYKLHSASIIMNKNNKKYCLCIYLYSVGKRAVVSALQSFDITFVITYLPTVSSLVFAMLPGHKRLQPHTILGLLNQLHAKEFKQKDCMKEFFFSEDEVLKETFVLRENTVYGQMVWGEKKNEGRSLCKVFLIRKKKPYMQTF